MEGPRGQAVTDNATSPVRKLYAALVKLDSINDVHENLLTDSDYERMTGDPEPRFCEWAYQQIEGRKLVPGLLSTVLRPTDARDLALESGCTPQQLVGLAIPTVLSEALREFGVRVPEVPSPVRDGLDQLKLCSSMLDQAIREIRPESLEDSDLNSPHPPVDLARRGAERLLKVFCLFLWDNGFKDTIQQVVSKGLWGFRGPKVLPPDWEEWLHEGDLGTLNFLLKSTSTEIKKTSLPVRFLSAGKKIWPNEVFEALNSLAKALQTAVHDTQTTSRYESDQKERMQRHFKAVKEVWDIFSGAKPEIEMWRPRTIQFFRSVNDGFCIHHEGYDEKGDVVRFYESSHSYDLHVPYLFVAATNPSAVDVSCSKLRPEFTRSV
jgi:hypothetical protein